MVFYFKSQTTPLYCPSKELDEIQIYTCRDVKNKTCVMLDITEKVDLTGFIHRRNYNFTR